MTLQAKKAFLPPSIPRIKFKPPLHLIDGKRQKNIKDKMNEDEIEAQLDEYYTLCQSLRPQAPSVH